MLKIYPSILEASADTLFQLIASMQNVFDYFQIDIADGVFVPNKTASLEEVLTTQSQNTKLNPEIEYEFHLMVKDYKPLLDTLSQVKSINIARALIHFQTLTHTPEELKNLYTNLNIGITLNPSITIENSWDIIQGFSTIQLMTVEPGFQGSPFIPDVLSKITELRERKYTGTILLDGAMNSDTLKQVLSQKHKPDAICPGSYFTKHPEDAQNQLAKLRNIEKTL